MLKRIMTLAIVSSTLVLLAIVPMSVSAISDDMPKLQTTVEVPISTVPAGQTAAPGIPVTGGGIPMSTMIILALLVIVGTAVVIGGAALLNRQQ